MSHDKTPYPKRERFFAHRLVRILTKDAVANDLGAEVCWLLTVIAMQEDAKRYRGPVTYYNAQLMPLCGCSSDKNLDRIRTKAIKSGFLHYVPGGRMIPGRYWCLIPDSISDIPDGPCDEESEDPGGKREDNGNDREGNSGEHREESAVQMADNRPLKGGQTACSNGGELPVETGNLLTYPLCPGPLPAPEEERGAADAASPRPSRRRNGAEQFVQPTEADVAAYCSEEGLSGVDQASWLAFYRSNGWKVGRNPMRDWRACLQRWDREERAKNTGGSSRTAASGRRDGFRGDFLLGFGPASPPIPTTAEVAQ